MLVRCCSSGSSNGHVQRHDAACGGEDGQEIPTPPCHRAGNDDNDDLSMSGGLMAQRIQASIFAGAGAGAAGVHRP